MRTFAQKPKASQPTASAKSTIFAPSHSGQSGAVNAILHSHRAIGDTAQRQQEADTATGEGQTTTETAGVGFDFSRIPVHAPAPAGLQTKLALGTPGDVYEQEADRIAEQVMRMREPQRASANQASVHAGGENTHAHVHVQTKSVQAGDSGGAVAPPIVHDVLRSPGRPLDAATRAFMEPRFGRDFSHVRVHAGARAAESARRIGAHAYTFGRDIVVGAGGSVSGRQGSALLAHELAHVMQQDCSTIRRQPENKTGKGDPVVDDTKGLTGEKLIIVLIDKLKKKTYPPDKRDEAAGADPKEKFGRDATRDAYEFTEKVDDEIRTYLRSPAGTALLGTLDDLPRGHALRLFARDWHKAENQLHDFQETFGKRLGKWLYGEIESNTNVNKVTDLLGQGSKKGVELFVTALGENSTTDDFAKANKAALDELPGFMSSIAKDLAGKPLFLKRAVKWAQSGLVDPDVLVAALWASVSVAESPLGTKLIKDAYAKVDKKKIATPFDLGKDVHGNVSAETIDTSFADLFSKKPPPNLLNKAELSLGYKKNDTSLDTKFTYGANDGVTGEQLLKWGKNYFKSNQTFSAEPKVGMEVSPGGGFSHNVSIGFPKSGPEAKFAIKQDPKKIGKSKNELGYGLGFGLKNADPSVSGSLAFKDANQFKADIAYQGTYGSAQTHEVSGSASKGWNERWGLFAKVVAKLPKSSSTEIDMTTGVFVNLKKGSKYALVGETEVTMVNADAVGRVAAGMSFDKSAVLLGYSSGGKFEIKFFKTLPW